MLGAAVLAAGLSADGASAVFPGRDGMIVFAAAEDICSQDDCTHETYGVFGWAPGRRIRRLNLPRDAGAPAFAPGGRRLAFTRDDGGLWTSGVDGSALRRISPVEVADSSWSPDGRLLVVQRVRDRRLYLIAGTGGRVRSLRRVGRSPAWSARGNIAFIAPLPGDRFEDRGARLMMMDANGGGLRELYRVRGSSSSLGDPDWSPDGRRLIFSRRPGPRMLVWTAGRVHELKRRAGAEQTVFSPAGTRIASYAADSGLSIGPADGRAARLVLGTSSFERVVDFPVQAEDFAWQPLG